MKQPILDHGQSIGLKSGVLIFLALILLAQSQQVLAQSKHDSRLVTVEELMHLDAQAALRLARRQQFDELPSSSQRESTAGQQPDAGYSKAHTSPVVQAIYGMGRALTAEVQIGQDIHILGPRNKRSPEQGGTALVLERIDPPCVHIKRDQQKEVLCLQQVRP